MEKAAFARCVVASWEGLSMDDKFRVHQSALIRTGKHAGVVGTVTDTEEKDGVQTRVRVRVSAVVQNEPREAHFWLKRSAVDRF